MTAAIAISGLTKHFGAVAAVEGLDLTVEPGEIFGFLGPNGAGKTTTIRLLLDFIRPTSGGAQIAGFDCRRESHRVRAVTSYLPGDLHLYASRTSRDILALVAKLRRAPALTPATTRILDRLDLDLDRPVGQLSKGNRQKLGILLAFVGEPRVLLLDEPTSGLDPLMQHAFTELVREAAASGATVFFSSHVMSEVEQICGRVGIMRRGKLAAVEAVASLRGKAVRHAIVTFADGLPPPGTFEASGLREIARNRTTVEVEVEGGFDPLLRALVPYRVADLRTEQPSLEEILLRYYEDAVP